MGKKTRKTEESRLHDEFEYYRDIGDTKKADEARAKLIDLQSKGTFNDVYEGSNPAEFESWFKPE